MNFVKRGLETVLWEIDVKLYMSGTPRFLLGLRLRSPLSARGGHSPSPTSVSIKANLIDRHCGSNLALVGVQHKKSVGGGLAGYWDQLNILAILPPAIGVFYSTLDFLHHKPGNIQGPFTSIPESHRSCLYSNAPLSIPGVFVIRINNEDPL
ncbi:hypothetical protein ASPTUDRAFT_61770 [Aspergillus tubingensis CBS 134.48]|uniref:Uncharacterized protein n=1 Tax=Aspergillus tubingensis (strain CBS 134.48) TaxID=767770 RepID=A0A1L9NEN6_ASPTC|nr:hypothetical protein ASPTUDRAFT_61770 [Aspergillus tubingensis CBS 134.48]